MKAAERVGDLKLKRNKIRDMPADTVAQSVDSLCDKHQAWVRIQASVKFFIFYHAFFLLCYSGDGLISTGVSIIQ